MVPQTVIFAIMEYPDFIMNNNFPQIDVIPTFPNYSQHQWSR